MHFLKSIIFVLFPSALAAPVLRPVARSEALNDIINAIEKYFPEINAAISTVAGIITTAEVILATLTGTPTTQNGLAGACRDMTVIFARGTADPGNVGFLTGPAFFQAIEDIIGSSRVAVQGVAPYAASVDGFLEGGDPIGAASMAAQVTQAFTKCPNTKVIMSGYSQGGQVTHKAAALLPAATMAKVSGVIIFGDPLDGKAVVGITPAKTLIICSPGDNICDGGDLILLPHLLYAIDAPRAAAFAIAAAGL